MSEDVTVNRPPAWRDAVRQAMCEAAADELLEDHGTQQVSFNYRWEHVQSVAALAVRLAQLTGADVDVVEAAAWLHDICKEMEDQHPQAGARYAREFLPQTDFPAEKIDPVARAIEHHMGRWREEPLTDLASMILWDADKLTKIGLTAAFHWMGKLLAGTESTSVADLIDYGRNAEWQEKTVDSMHTEPAQRAAEKRLARYDWLWNALEAELQGDDLSPDDLSPDNRSGN